MGNYNCRWTGPFSVDKITDLRILLCTASVVLVESPTPVHPVPGFGRTADCSAGPAHLARRRWPWPSCHLFLINISTTTAAELEALPGIGPARARDIVAYREANGPFERIEDIQNVSGIGPAIFEGLKDLITVGA